MDFALSDSQRALRKTIMSFAREQIAPGASERDATGVWDQELWDSIGKLGVLGIPIPEKYGGLGADAVTTMVALEALGEGGMDTGLCVSIGAHMVLVEVPLWLFGTDSQKQHYLPRLCSGSQIGAFALTEPEAGSDAASLRTSMRQEAEHFVLNGAKTFITNAPRADVLIAFATRDRKLGAEGISSFVVEKGTPGLRVGRTLAKMGNHSTPTGEVFFDDCIVAKTAMLGGDGRGFTDVAATAMVWERAILFAGVLGVLQGTMQMVLEYASQRRQFNRRIADFQMVKSKLADMSVQIHAARLLSYHAAWCLDQGAMANFYASVSKLFTTETAIGVLQNAMEIYGGYGYMKDYPIERIYREMAVTPVGGGTSSIHRLIIAHQLLEDFRARVD